MKRIPQFKIEIRNQSKEEAVIDIDGEIGGFDFDTWEMVNTPKKIKDQLKKIADLDTKKIVVNINSLGGFIDDGLAIHDILASHDAEIETNVIGMTASAATIIAQAGDVRKISDNALYLIHRGWGGMIGNANDAEAFAEDLRTMDKRIANIYAKRSDKSVDEMLDLMDANNGDGKWIDAEEAKELGLVDEVYEPMKAAAAVDMSMFKNMGLPIPENVDLPIVTNQKNKREITYKLNIDTSELKERLKAISKALDPKEEPKQTNFNKNKRQINLLKNKVKWM